LAKKNHVALKLHPQRIQKVSGAYVNSRSMARHKAAAQRRPSVIRGAMTSLSDKTSRIARCIALAGSVPAGVLLYRIMWWNSQQKVQFGHEFWIVQSHAGWGLDTGLTPQQLKEAFAKLKKLGLIRSEKHLRENRIFAFLQLTSEALTGNAGEDQHD
jgi:hypothetical protein